ncbi:MAG: efflux RND transporter permease subunit, partial [Spirochaetaceae bacterium]|nr:efflux RND transporter permease subunit [Spirochaetaceae bacterium]
MKISDYAIAHPAVVGIALISLTLFGVLSVLGMPRDLLANIDMPEILVLTVYPGASPEVTEQDVTEPLEEEFSLIEGVRKIYSESQNGFSMVFVTLDWDSDIDAKKNDIRDRINNASSKLPDGISGSPRLYELGTSSLPVYTCLVESELDSGTLARMLEDRIVPRFSRLRDVSAVYARGVEEPALRVYLDPGKLDALDITALEAYAALRKGQSAVPAGAVQIGPDRLALQSEGRFSDIRQVGRQPVGYNSSGIPILAQDVARIVMGYEKPEFRALTEGRRTVALDIMKRPGGNTVELIESVGELQRRITAETGGNIRFVPVVDNAEVIDITLSSVSRSAWLGGLLAVMVLLLFLHDLRAALIVSLSIPFTIFLSFVLMRAKGMSLNIMTLAGMTVSIGMIVDASIVILENTVRHRKLGLSAGDAASKGADEVGSAVIASTTTSLSVFIPILFVSGLAGAVLKEVSWILVFALGSAALTAVVIVPWLSSRILKEKGKANRFAERFDAFFDRVSDSYSRFLSILLNRKKFVILFAAVLVLSSLSVMGILGGELFSAPDMNEFEVSVRMPPGYDLTAAETKMKEISAVVDEIVTEKETALWYAGLGDSGTVIDSGNPLEGYGRVRLIRTRQRKRSVFDIVNILNRELPARVTDADITVRNGGLAKQMNYATDGSGFRVELSGSDWNDVLDAAITVSQSIEADPLVRRSSFNIRLDKETLNLDVDREDAGRLGVDTQSAGLNLRILFEGEEAGALKTDGESYPIIVASSLAGELLPEGILGRIHVRNAAEATVPYSAFSKLNRKSSSDSIPHTDRLPSLIVIGELIESDLSAITARMERTLTDLALPTGVSWRIVGVADVMGDTFRDLGIALAVSIFLVYAVMVVQFERFTQPFIIMGAVPFVLIGVTLSMAAFGARLTMMTFFGVIALGGMVVNNAIVLVDFTNRRRRDGLDVREAILDAAKVRLKPILITTLTTLLGLVPLAFALGEGSEIYAPLGQVIGGGLVTSTLITLGIVPALYEAVELRKCRRRRQRTTTVLPVLLAALLFGSFGGATDLWAEDISAGPWDEADLKRIALSVNPDIAVAREALLGAESQRSEAKAERGPVLRMELSSTYLSDPLLRVPAGALGEFPAALPPSIGGTPIPSVDTNVWGSPNDFRYDVTASIEQPVYSWGKISSAVRLAEAGFHGKQWLLEARKTDVSTSVAIACESLALMDQMIGLADRQIELGERLIELTFGNYQEGFILETEYRETRSMLQRIQLNAAVLRKERNDRLLSLEALTGLDDLSPASLVLQDGLDDVTDLLLPDIEDTVGQAVKTNPDILALAAKAEAALASRFIAVGGKGVKPDVVFRGEFGYGGGFDRAPDDLNGAWTLSLGARTTLFDAGRSASAYRTTESDYRVSEAELRSARRRLETTLRELYNAMELYKEKISFYSGLLESDIARSAEKRATW